MNSEHQTSEEVIAPPETSGIVQQPTQEELSVIASSYEAPSSSKKPTAVQLLVVGGIIIVGAIMATWFMNSTRQNEVILTQPEQVEVVLEPEATVSADVSQFSLVDHIFAGTFKEEFAEVMLSESFDTQWKDRGLDFTMRQVHDLGVVSSSEYILSPEYVGKKVVVVELQVVDTRLTGEPIEMNADTYVATRYEQTDTTAADWRETLMKPGEEKIVYIPFILDRKSLTYFILSGDLRNPFVSPMGEPVSTSQPEAN